MKTDFVGVDSIVKNMRSVTFLVVQLIAVMSVWAAVNTDSTATFQYVKTWRLTDGMQARVDSIHVDTIHKNFQLDNHIDRFSISNSFRGNLGSPIQSKLYFDRPQQHEFIFADAYYPYLHQLESTTFFNTKTPFSSLYYITGGTNYYEDEQFKFLFTANANRKFNMGIVLDYLYARGEYENLAAKRFAGTLFGSYSGKNYSATGFLATNNHSNFENGGIRDTSYINGSIDYPARNIPVNIKGFSNLKLHQLFYNQSYTLGIDRPVRVDEDSVRMEYVPVTVFSHTLNISDYHKRYYEPSVERDFYENTFFPQAFTNDTAAYRLISNRLSVSMAEEFNKWLKFGLTAYLENDIERYVYQIDTLVWDRLNSSTKVGAVLSSNQSEFFRYNFSGELYLLGRRAGDFLLNAQMTGAFPIGKHNVQLDASGFVRSETPSFFNNYYHSNHFKWDQSLDKLYRTHLEGSLSVPVLGFALTTTLENISNLIYYDLKAMPTQYDGNVQVLAANLKQNFKAGKFSLENNVVYQLSSNEKVLPLPMLTLYHNFYYSDLWFKVLSIQAGVDARYHSLYYAPAYMPATGQFHVQERYKIGNYPMVNLYINAHLKRTRFFAQYYHVNNLFMKGDYYSMPYYPLYPAQFRMGVTWNFYD
jgi:hypothetical protein